jgi:hypothetical protein
MKRKIVIGNDHESKDSSKKVKKDVNFLNGQEYSERYYELLQTRQKLPAY